MVESMNEGNVVLKDVASSFKQFLTPDPAASSAAAAASDLRMKAIESNVGELKEGMAAILNLLQKR